MSNTSLEELECQAIETLRPPLSKPIAVARLAMKLIVLATNSFQNIPLHEMPSSLRVLLTLVVRLANDLRVVILLASRGYALQAVSQAASVSEVAFTIGFIGSDKGRAQEWADHDDPTHPFKDLKMMMWDVIRRSGEPNTEAIVFSEYQVYTQLCMAKHGNPLVQKYHGVQATGGDLLIRNGPDTSEKAVTAAWYALQQAARLTVVAVTDLSRDHAETHQQRALSSSSNEVLDKLKALSKIAREKGWTTDPFPGKWRKV